METLWNELHIFTVQTVSWKEHLKVAHFKLFLICLYLFLVRLLHGARKKILHYIYICSRWKVQVKIIKLRYTSFSLFTSTPGAQTLHLLNCCIPLWTNLDCSSLTDLPWISRKCQITFGRNDDHSGQRMWKTSKKGLLTIGCVS